MVASGFKTLDQQENFEQAPIVTLVSASDELNCTCKQVYCSCSVLLLIEDGPPPSKLRYSKSLPRDGIDWTEITEIE